jgi:hypothetical protein
MITQDNDLAWRRYALWAVCSSLGLFALIIAGLYVIDPYDTGRTPWVRKPWLQGQRAGDATPSVGRNPDYSAAVIGNSTIALVRPSRLGELTGIPFAQLSIPAAPIRGQLTVIDWFIRHHQETARALVVSIDRDTWCTRDPDLKIARPFPLWRYSASHLEYLEGLISLTSVQQAIRSIGAVRSTKVMGTDGFWDYEPMYAPIMRDEPRRLQILLAKTSDHGGDTVAPFPAADALEAKLNALPRPIPVILVFPPVFSAKQPEIGTPRHNAEQSCKRRFQDLASRRPGTSIVDWWDDRPELKSVDLFIDQIHIRRPLANLLEEEIAAALKPATTSELE